MKALSNWEKETIDLIEDLVSRHGYKNTTQRREILFIFLKNKEKHFSVDEIYENLKFEGIGLATIYRNINVFVKLKILKEFKVDNTSYYELKMYAKKPLHIHFQCSNCNVIKDIVDEDIVLEYLKLNKLIEKKHGSQIRDIDIMLHGLCKDCLK